MTRNFEKAIGLCSGDVIALSDQDDVWMADKLETLAGVLAGGDDVGAVFSDARIVDDRLRPTGTTKFENSRFGVRRRQAVQLGTCYPWLLTHDFVAGMSLAFKARYKPLILPLPHDDKNMIHDRWITLVVAAVSRIACVDRPLVLYRQHASQQIGSANSPGLARLRRLAHPPQAPGERERNFLQASKTFGLLKERLSRPATGASAAFLDAINENIVHLERRASMSERRRQRLGPVLGELLSARYSRYSRGLASAVKDLLW